MPGYSKDGGKNVKMKDGKEKNVMPVSTATYSECGWRAWLNGTTVTLGMQNVFDADPPFVAGAFENNYDESLADVRGRFWYVGLKKRFKTDRNTQTAAGPLTGSGRFVSALFAGEPLGPGRVAQHEGNLPLD